MIISYKHKSIFFHNPKTAGSSINHLFMHETGCKHDVGYEENPMIYPFISNSQRHFNPNDYLDKLSNDEFAMKIFSKFFKFAFTRNPYDRLVSLYCYLQQKPWHNRETFNRNNPTFEGWVQNIYNQYKSSTYVDQSVEPQHVWTHRNGSPVVDFIGRYEKFDKDFQSIADTIGLTFDREVRSNATTHKDYRDFYDTATRKLVGEIFEEDLDLYRYSF